MPTKPSRALRDARAIITIKDAQLRDLQLANEAANRALDSASKDHEAVRKLRGDLSHAAHLLGIAGEALATRGAHETARMMHAAARSYAPPLTACSNDGSASHR